MATGYWKWMNGAWQWVNTPPPTAPPPPGSYISKPVNPTVGDVLQFNGTTWVNAPLVVEVMDGGGFDPYDGGNF